MEQAAGKLHHNAGRKWGKPFQKGVSSNPGGRRKDTEGCADYARGKSLKALQTLARLMTDKRVAASTRAFCAERLLDRGLGKPLQTAAVAIGTLRELAELTDAELMQIASGQALPATLPSSNELQLDANDINEIDH
jgi:hypothetical protein